MSSTRFTVSLKIETYNYMQKSTNTTIIMISSGTIITSINRKFSIIFTIIVLIIYSTSDICVVSSQFTTTTTTTTTTIFTKGRTTTPRSIFTTYRHRHHIIPSPNHAIVSFQIGQRHKQQHQQQQRKYTHRQKLWKLHDDDISQIPVHENNEHLKNLPLKQSDTSTSITPTTTTANDLSNTKLSSSFTIQSVMNQNSYSNQRRSFLSQFATSSLVPLFAVTSSTYVNVAHAAVVDDTTIIEPVLVPEIDTTVPSSEEAPKKIIFPTARNQKLVVTIVSKPNNTICSKIQSRTNDLLEFYYEAYIGNDEVSGQLYDSSYARSGSSSGTYAYVLGSGDIIPGIDQGLYNMCLDEIRTIVVPPVLGYSTSGLKLYKIPQNTNIFWKIQLVSINFISSSDDRTRSDIE